MASGSDIEKGHADESFPKRRGMTDKQWKSTFSTELSKAESPLPSSCCIFKVPEVLRSQKEAAYEPHIVSIGPFHRGAEKYKLVENVKKLYLKCFLARQHQNPTGLDQDGLIESLGHDGLIENLGQAENLTGLGQDGLIEGLGQDGLIESLGQIQNPTGLDQDGLIESLSQAQNPTGLGQDDLIESLEDDLIEILGQAGLIESPPDLIESPPDFQSRLDHLTERIKGDNLDKRARSCYEPCFDLEENEFIEMLILDGCFLIELFRKVANPNRHNDDDPIFNKPCMLVYLYRDLLFLENQLPWFILEFFYGLIENGNPKPLTEVVIDFFKDSVADATIFSHLDFSNPCRHYVNLHILDLIRDSLTEKKKEDPSSIKWGNWGSSPMSSIDHLRHKIPNVVALSEVGVKFRKGPSGCILNITFKDGVFTIPPLGIDERTGPLFRNLIAYEQCYHSCSHWITSYAVLMDNLIDTNKDVDLLCEKEILANGLSAYDATNFFNNLYNETTVGEYQYKELCGAVQIYHKEKWNRWREKLRREYFDSPWSIISFFAAFVILVLTFLGTMYTIQSYYHPRN